MKRIILFVTLVLLWVAPSFGAMTYDQAYYRNNRGYLGSATSNDPLYNLWGTLEGLYEGSSNFDAIRIIESTGATYWTKIQGGNQSANLTLTLPTAYAGASGYVLSSTDAGVLSWVANGGTFEGGNITSDAVLNADGVDILADTTTAHTFAIQGYADAGAYKDVLRWTNGAAVAAVLGASDVTFSLASTGLDISSAGAVSNATTITATGLITGGGWSGTGNFAQGDGTGTAAFNTSVWDITTAGALSGFTTLSLSDSITLANGKSIKGSSTTAETISIQVYDNDTGPGYKDAILLTNGNTPAIAIGDNNPTVAINSSDWDISTTGAMTGIGAITMDGALSVQNATVTLYTNEATTVGHAANGAADDLTISQTGAFDASLILQSAGTGADALKINAAAGGLDIDAAVGATFNAAGDPITIQVDSDGAGDDLTIKVDGDDDSSIILDSDGTGADAVKIGATNAAGGIDVDAGTNGIAVTATGGAIAVTSTKDAAASIALLANSAGTNDTITITNTPGTAAGAITLLASAGGITLNGASGGVVFTAGQTRKVLYDVNDVKTDVTNPPTRGEIGTAGQFMADALKFDADGGATGDDIVFLSWVVPDGYKVDSARLNVYWSHSAAEDAADEAVFDFAVNAAAVGESLDAAGTAADAVTTVIADASASAGKLQKTQLNIEVEDIAVGDLVTVKLWVDENVSALSASGTLDVHYFEIEYESTE